MTNWLANFFENLGEMFEKFNPAAFRFLAAVLPYSTPLPVAWITMRSASEFLGFDPFISFVFVFGLEGMGLWFTSLFVDSVIEAIRSRNSKGFFMVVLFGLVVGAYVYLLVNLNVTLKFAVGEANPALQRVITLLCLLPLLTGVGNGYYKWQLEYNIKQAEREDKQLKTDAQIRQEQNELKLKRSMIKQGMNPLQTYASETILPKEHPDQDTYHRGDWRTLTSEQRHEVIYVLKVDDIMRRYNVSRATAYNWKKGKV